jgi:hypothetical protein
MQAQPSRLQTTKNKAANQPAILHQHNQSFSTSGGGFSQGAGANYNNSILEKKAFPLVFDWRSHEFDTSGPEEPHLANQMNVQKVI